MAYIDCLGQMRTVYGGLLAFLANTLTAHAVGGFKESMSFALRICRSGMITQLMMHKIPFVNLSVNYIFQNYIWINANFRLRVMKCPPGLELTEPQF